MKKILLNELLQGFVSKDLILPEIFVTGLCLDSRQIKPGDLFFAYPGELTDGRKFIAQAIKGGASAVLQELSAVIPEPCAVIPEPSAVIPAQAGIPKEKLSRGGNDNKKGINHPAPFGGTPPLEGNVIDSCLRRNDNRGGNDNATNVETPNLGVSTPSSPLDQQTENVIIWEGIPVISTSQLRGKVSHIADRFYQYPSREMKVIGITGTSGKTSCSHFLAQALQLLGQKSGVLGTLGYGVWGAIQKSATATMTTPDPLFVQATLNDLRNQGVQYVTMETTSHALKQDRVAGVKISMGILTNVTRDHLDYHHTLEAYALAKRTLFESPDLQYGIFNFDDPRGLEWAHRFKDHYPICGYSLNASAYYDLPCVMAQNIVPSQKGLGAEVLTPWGIGTLKSSLIGRFNMANLLGVISALGLIGYPLQDILDVVSDLDPVRGRMQILGGQGCPLIVIDNAHKPDALKQVLMALRECGQGKLICVFGCGGNRDRGKRPIMGAIAEELADKVVITNDNLRFEDQETIVKDILSGILRPDKVQVEYDREKAIRSVIAQASINDIILLAGKGHEPYQIVGDQCIPFSEAEIVKEALG